MYPEIFRIGNFPINTYGVLLALAFLAALLTAARLAGRDGLPRERVYDLGLWMLLAALVGSEPGASVTQLPLLHAADVGVGYVTGSNRFWRAMAAAGLATRVRDFRHLLHHDRIGMTDLVKRATPVYLMHGNRDFLLGKRFCAATGGLAPRPPSRARKLARNPMTNSTSTGLAIPLPSAEVRVS